MLVIFQWQFILFCCTIISICLCVIGVLNLRVHSLVVKKWIIISSLSLHKRYIWHSVFIGVRPHSAHSFTSSSFLPFPFPPPLTSLLHFLPHPLPTPSFLCLLLLPWFTFSANFYPFFVKWLSLTLFTVSAWLQKRGWGEESKWGKKTSCWLKTKRQIWGCVPFCN